MIVIQMDIKRLLNSETGRIMISILLGLGFSAMFRKICKDRNCMEFYGVPIEKIQQKTFQHEDKCFQYQPKTARCNPTVKRVVPFDATAVV